MSLAPGRSRLRRQADEHHADRGPHIHPAEETVDAVEALQANGHLTLNCPGTGAAGGYCAVAEGAGPGADPPATVLCSCRPRDRRHPRANGGGTLDGVLRGADGGEKDLGGRAAAELPVHRHLEAAAQPARERVQRGPNAAAADGTRWPRKSRRSNIVASSGPLELAEG